MITTIDAANDNDPAVLLLTDVVDAATLDQQRLTRAFGWVNGVRTRPQPRPAMNGDSFWTR